MARPEPPGRARRLRRNQREVTASAQASAAVEGATPLIGPEDTRASGDGDVPPGMPWAGARSRLATEHPQPEDAFFGLLSFLARRVIVPREKRDC